MSPIVNPSVHARRIAKAVPLFALLTALSAGCNERSQQTVEAAAATPAHEHSSGAERGLPGVESYAHRLDVPARDVWQKPDEVIRLLGCQPGMSVADLGAGTGYFIGPLSDAVGPEGRVIALDISPATVDWLNDRIEQEALGNVQPLLVSPDDPGLDRRSTDRILIANTWHHIENRVEYAKKLLATLRRRGMVLIVDFTMDSPHGPPATHRLTNDTVIEELEAAGFEAEILTESLPYQYAIAGRAR